LKLDATKPTFVVMMMVVMMVVVMFGSLVNRLQGPAACLFHWFAAGATGRRRPRVAVIQIRRPTRHVTAVHTSSNLRFLVLCTTHMLSL